MNTAAMAHSDQRAHQESGSISFKVSDIRCASCALRIEKKLLSVPGVSQCRTHLPTKRVIVDGVNDQQTLEHCISDLGFTPTLWDEREIREDDIEEKRAMLARLGVAGIGMMQVMMYALTDYVAGGEGLEPAYERLMQWASLAVAIPVALYSAQPFYISALRDLRARSAGMDVPVSLAILAAFTLSTVNLLLGRGQVYFDSVCMFTFLLLLGRFLEMGARHQYQDSLDLSDSCLPLTALSNKSHEPVLVKNIIAGDRLVVTAGSTIPADGRVVSGSGQVSEAAFTGESLPVRKVVGNRVLAGSVNLDGELVIEAESAFDDFVINAMNEKYQEASLYKPAFAILADRLARYFVVTVLGLAAATALFWAVAGSSQWFIIALTVLVVSCPCALSLATPVACTIALTVLRRRGVVVSTGSFLEKLPVIDTIVFDKTGTLTSGKLNIASIRSLSEDYSEQDILALCTALEAPSRHPVAYAFTSPHDFEVSEAKVIPGEGVQGVIKGKEYRLGKASFACGDFNPAASEQLMGAEEAGISIVLAEADKALAVIHLQDSLRDDVPALVTALEGEYRLAMLTGDRQSEASRLSAITGVPLLKSEVSPDEKLNEIRKLQDAGHRVLMVGDGINDAAAMAAAHASIAVSPVDILVQEAAEATLVRQDLLSVRGLIDYAQKVRRIIFQNITWAIGYNLIAIPLAMAGVLQPWMAALGMSVSSLLVVSNASRLRTTSVLLSGEVQN